MLWRDHHPAVGDQPMPHLPTCSQQRSIVGGAFLCLLIVAFYLLACLTSGLTNMAEHGKLLGVPAANQYTGSGVGFIDYLHMGLM
jgi:hypothetical protein